MVAIIVSDIILYLLFLSRNENSPAFLLISCIFNRFFLFIFGGDYWIYGYMILYFYYGFFFSVIIARKRFPFENAYAKINLDTIAKKSFYTDISKIPEFLFGFVHLVLVVLFAVMTITKPNNVPLLDL